MSQNPPVGLTLYYNLAQQEPEIFLELGQDFHGEGNHLFFPGD